MSRQFRAQVVRTTFCNRNCLDIVYLDDFAAALSAGRGVSGRELLFVFGGIAGRDAADDVPAPSNDPDAQGDCLFETDVQPVWSCAAFLLARKRSVSTVYSDQSSRRSGGIAGRDAADDVPAPSNDPDAQGDSLFETDVQPVWSCASGS